MVRPWRPRSWPILIDGMYDASYISLIVKFKFCRIAAVPSFPGLRRFPEGRNFKQWMGDDAKALMKVRSCLCDCIHVTDKWCLHMAGLPAGNRRPCSCSNGPHTECLSGILLSCTPFSNRRMDTWCHWWFVASVPSRSSYIWNYRCVLCITSLSPSSAFNGSLSILNSTIWSSQRAVFLYHRVKTHQSR